MAKPVFQVVVKGSGWTQYGPTPDRIVSSHRTYEAAQKAFDRHSGHAILRGPDGKTLDHRII